MAKQTYTQLSIDGIDKVIRTFKRDKKGRFSKGGMTPEEKLYRENNVLKMKIRSLERQLENKDFQIEAISNHLNKFL